MTLRFRIQGIIVEQSPSYCDGPEKRKLGILALAWVFPFSTSPLPWSLANGTVPHLRKVYLLNNPSGNVLADVAGDVPWALEFCTVRQTFPHQPQASLFSFYYSGVL